MPRFFAYTPEIIDFAGGRGMKNFLKHFAMGLLALSGNVLIFIAWFAAYIWLLPLGLLLEGIAGYLYVAHRNAAKQNRLNSE